MRTLITMLFLVFLSGSTAFAQDSVSVEPGVHVKLPAGWESSSPSTGVAALFRMAGDAKTRVEMRVVSVENPEQAQRYFQSYHANLVATGLKITQASAEKTYGSVSGRVTKYSGAVKEGTFELVLFEFSNKGNAWLVIGFATEKRTPTMNAAFEAIVATITTAP
jgi:hypothetical protein